MYLVIKNNKVILRKHKSQKNLEKKQNINSKNEM